MKISKRLIEKLRELGDKNARAARICYFIKDMTKKAIMERFQIDAETLKMVLSKHSLIEDIVFDMYYREAVRASLKAKSGRIEQINHMIARGKRQ